MPDDIIINAAAAEAEEDSAKKIIDDLKAKHDIEMKQEQDKYTALLRAYTNNVAPASSDAESKPLTQDELKKQFEQDIMDIKENKLSDLEQAKKLLAINEYRESHGERSIFLPQDGTPSAEGLESAQKVKDLLSYSIEESNGDPDIFKAVLKSRLVDNKYI